MAHVYLSHVTRHRCPYARPTSARHRRYASMIHGTHVSESCHTHEDVRVHMNASTCARRERHTVSHGHTRTRTPTRTPAPTPTPTHAHTHTNIFAHAHARTHKRTNAHTHTHAHVHTSWRLHVEMMAASLTESRAAISVCTACQSASCFSRID